ncbi:MAG TPA: J domain-containing protein [Verrucomicrobiae bacterium]|nr:J domain-containing protein [Verrucomicrobiae bacterium]
MDDEVQRCCQVLGLEAPASPQQLKNAYRDLVKVWHPDRFSHDERLRLIAQEKLKEINRAYEFLLGHAFAEETPPPGPDEAAGEPPPVPPEDTPVSTGRTSKWTLAFGAFALVVVVATLFAFWRARAHHETDVHIAKPHGPVIANHVYTAADDFIVDIFHNGRRISDNERTMVAEMNGATAEKADIIVREGDWLVFNVVNNRLRWNAAYYFAAVGIGENGAVGFSSELQSGHWSFCDDPAEVTRFIAEPGYMATNHARAVERPWGRGDDIMKGFNRDWQGQPLWGTNRNTWLKFVAVPDVPVRTANRSHE